MIKKAKLNKTLTDDLEEVEGEETIAGGDPVGFWEKKQRELVPSVVDYNLQSLADLVVGNIIDVAPRYQRRFRWDQKRQSKLIESFLMNVPVPPIFLNEDDYGKYSVIDGKQRLLAIKSFMMGELTLTGLEVFSDINGRTFKKLPKGFQDVIRVRPILRAIILLRQSDKDVKFEVFQRLNTGGVQLNAQEIRNSAFTGPLNDLILKLAEGEHFHKLLGIRNKEGSRIYQEMKDAEFVLRFLAFRKTWKSFSGGVKYYMDSFMESHRYASQKELEAMENDFLQTIACVDAAFGDHAFHRWQPEKGSWRNQVVASLFDAQIFACRGRDPENLSRKSKQIVADFKTLFKEDDFRKHVDSATNTPAFFKERIKRVIALLDKIG